jgi:hypothetical protein
MESSGNLLQYVNGPIQLTGLVLLVLAGLVPLLAGRDNSRIRRTLVFGLLILGGLIAAGGIGLEAARIENGRGHGPAAADGGRETRASSVPDDKPTATQEAHAADDAMSIAAGGDVDITGKPAATSRGREHILPPTPPSNQSATATGRGVAITSGRNVHVDQR